MPSSAATARLRSTRRLQGIDRGMLHLEARFSHEKRMEKIAAVFPVTFALIGAGRTASCAASSMPARRWISAGSRTHASSTIS